jgi:hypothetical protein
MLAIREYLVLQRQECAARVDQVDTGQPVFERDFLRPQVLLDRDRVVRAAFHRRVIRDHHELAAVNAADSRHQAGRRRVVVVHSTGGERGQLQERAAGVQQPVDAVSHQQLAAVQVLAARRVRASAADHRRALAQLGDELGEITHEIEVNVR